MDNKFILTTDVNTAMLFKKQGFQLVGQDGKNWFYLADDEKLAMSKQLFTKKKAKYTTTNKMMFSDWYGTQYIKA